MLSRNRLGYIRPPVEVDSELKSLMLAQGDPLQRFRFAGGCIESRCGHWDDRCRLIDSLVASPAAADGDADLPACAIRANCRWFAQDGRAACAICPRVVYSPPKPV
jgi:hypothetical protein